MDTTTETRTPAELRALADRIESQQCTGIAASWCPVHGTCRCPKDFGGQPVPRLDDEACPLHSTASSHASAVSS